MKRINHILIAAMVLVLVAMFANANIPPAPAELNNDIGNYWVNYTWSKELGGPLDDDVNVTDSFNVSMNGTWYNGTATFLDESVGPGGWANITVWAYNATGNGNMSVGNVSDYVQAPAMVDPPDDNPCTIMHPDGETLMEWIARYNAAPMVNISGDGVMAPLEYSVLDRLDYNATERNQSSCGNCWVWAATGCMEVAHDAENDVFDRLSIQYLNSLYYDGTGAGHACCGGTLGWFVDFYSVDTTSAVPWNNTNASWQDGGTGCSGSTAVPAASIATMPHYAITHIEALKIPTQDLEATAIENIKSVLASDNAIWFAFYLPTDSDWANFTTFWTTGSETDLWSPDHSCGHTWEEPGGGGHAVLCVGYNATAPDPYWIMLNSWGASANRPNGLFRMNMDINYSCCFDYNGTPYYSLEWQMLEIDFADICVNETGWWRHGSEFHGNNTPIQAAVDAAEDGETIHVAAGSYTENVNIGTSHLTLVGEGADVVTVTAHGGSVFSVTADYVNISGFNVNISGVTVNGAQEEGAGIYLNDADYCNITGNTASDNAFGIYLSSSSDNTLTSNTASDNDYGIYLSSSSDNTLANNTMSGNDYNFGVYADSLSDYTQNIDMSNTVDGKPIYYWVDQQGGQIPTDAGYVGVVNSTNIIVRDLNLAKNLQGILFVNTSNSTIDNVTTSDNDYCGIWLGHSSNDNTLTSNTASGNYYGIVLGDSSNYNMLTDNDASGNGAVGIALGDSSNNTLTSNTASNNYYGIGLYGSSNNTLLGNTANSNNNYGIYLYDSSTNTLYQNSMYNHSYSNAIDTGANNWNSSSLGNYYDLAYQTYMLTETAYSWINTTQSDADWNDTSDDGYSPKVSIGFDFILDDVTYTHIQVVSNGVIQLIPDGGTELNDSTYASPTYWSTDHPDETFIFALCDNLYPDTGWYGYTTYTAGDNDSGNNPVTQNLTVIDYYMSTYSDGNYTTNPNDYQVVLYEDGTMRFNFKNLNYTMFGSELYSGIYLGNSSSTYAKETIHVARAGQYSNETSYSTPIIRTLSSTYDDNGDGIADTAYPIGNGGDGTGTAVDNYPLVTASKASSPASASSGGTVSFTVSTTVIDHASVGIDNIALYYKKDIGTWTKYAESTTGTFAFSTSSGGEYYFYTVATDNCGKVEGVPSTYDSKTAVGASSGGGSSGGSGTYPPGWFGTPTPTVTATKAPAATTTATAAPPGERVTPAPTKVKPVAAKAAAPAAEGTTAGTAKKSASGFTAVFAIAGMLAVAYVVMRRRE